MTDKEAKVTTRIVRCPGCGKSVRYDLQNPDRPFCSSRCKTMDVARWAEESYRIPSKGEGFGEGEIEPDEEPSGPRAEED